MNRKRSLQLYDARWKRDEARACCAVVSLCLYGCPLRRLVSPVVTPPAAHAYTHTMQSAHASGLFPHVARLPVPSCEKIRGEAISPSPFDSTYAVTLTSVVK